MTFSIFIDILLCRCITHLYLYSFKKKSFRTLKNFGYLKKSNRQILYVPSPIKNTFKRFEFLKIYAFAGYFKAYYYLRLNSYLRLLLFIIFL